MITEDNDNLDEELEEEDANLTDAEREAMKIDLDDDDDEPDAVDESDDDEEDDEAEETAEAEPEEDAEPEPEPVAAQEPAQQKVEPAVEEPEEEDSYATDIAALNEQLKGVQAKYKDGELDTDEFLEQRDTLKDQLSDMKWERQRQELLYEAEAQAEAKADAKNLNQAMDDFYTANPEYANSRVLQAALDVSWKDVWVEPEWANKSYLAKLNEAMARTDESLGRVKSAEPETKKEDPAARKAAVKDRGKQVTAPTLADVPNADETTAESGGKYAALANLEGMELERALAQNMEKYGEGYLDDWLSQGEAH